MIVSDHQLETTRRKLGRLETTAARIRARLDGHACDATRVTWDSFRRLIQRLREEIRQYESGVAPTPRRTVLDPVQLQIAERKLNVLEGQMASLWRKPPTPARNQSRLTLRRTINQLKEEIAWSEVHGTCDVAASHSDHDL